MRPGVHALSLLAAPLNVHVLKALEEKPCSLNDLRRVVGSPPETTMRVYMRSLTDQGVLQRYRANEFAATVDYEITRTGRNLLMVGEVLQRWLQTAPEGPIALGSSAAKGATKALIDGWSAKIVRVLAARPMTLIELSKLIPSVTYPTLDRRLTAMRMVGLAEPYGDNGRGRPFRATEWLRRSVAPLLTATHWERVHVPEITAPIGRLEAEAAFLLAIPLLQLPSELSGACRMAVEVREHPTPEYAGVLVNVEAGRIASCVSRLEGPVDAWATGTPRDWLRQMTGYGTDRLEIGGDDALANAIIDCLRDSLLRELQL